MLKKILWFILIVLVLYIVFIFVSPANADKIGEKLGILHFNQKIREIRSIVNNIYSDLPSQDEVKDFYDKTLSGAIEGANNVKDKVDDVRENINNAADKFEEAKDKYNETKDTINNTLDQIESGIDAIKSLSGALSESGTTN